jgi:hypothetical protein
VDCLSAFGDGLPTCRDLEFANPLANSSQPFGANDLRKKKTIEFANFPPIATGACILK